MPQNVKIVKVAKKAGNRILHLSDGREILLCREIVENYKLKSGIEISTADLERITEESDLIRAERYASYLLARREYSAGMLSKKMELKGYPSDVIKSIVRQLKAVGHLDDTRFATNAVETILRNKPAGRKFLIAYLRSKYVPGVLAESVVDKLLENSDQNELAERLLRTRMRQYGKLDLESARRKAYNYLSRRAIGYGAAKFAFEKIINEKNEEQEN